MFMIWTQDFRHEVHNQQKWQFPFKKEKSMNTNSFREKLKKIKNKTEKKYQVYFLSEKT